MNKKYVRNSGDGRITIDLKNPEKCPPNSELSYAIASRRGPSVGKSSWKPGGSAHKVKLVEHEAKNGTILRWYVDAVTEKRVAPVRHDAAFHANAKRERLERLVRNLCWKSDHGGLTANEIDKLKTLALDEVVQGQANIVTLIRKTLFIPSDAGRLRTRRNVKTIKKESYTMIGGIRVLANGSRTVLASK